MQTATRTDEWQKGAALVSTVLKSVGNERRLLILCQLVANTEMSVSALEAELDLSQSALSQHLARMRADGILSTRRDGLAIYYRIADARVRELMATLYDLYCARSD